MAGRRAKTGKAAFARAVKRLAGIYRAEGASEKACAALSAVHAAAVRAAVDTLGECGLRVTRHGVVLIARDGSSWILLYPYGLEEYVTEGMPLPEGARPGILDCFYFQVCEAAATLRALARAVSCFPLVRAWGLVPEEGGFVYVDARALLREMIRYIRNKGGAAAYLRKGMAAGEGPVPLRMAAEVKGLWRDWIEGRVAL
ncbi:MAG: hypothetical protein H5T97_09880 [Firmicutes bacterium]|nr:hypothetical protein [Bacillota bacterium]